MSKFFALLRNEMTKSSRRVFLYIIYALIIIGILGIGILYQIITRINNIDVQEIVPYAEREQEIENTYKDLQNQLEITKQKIEKAENPNDVLNMQYEYFSIKDELITYKIAIDNKINIFNSDYLTTLLYNYKDLLNIEEFRALSDESSSENLNMLDKQYLIDRGNYSYSEFSTYSDAEIQKQKELIEQVFENKNYSEYINLKIENTKQNKTLDEKQKEFAINDLKLEFKLNPEGISYYEGLSQINNWQFQRDQSYKIIRDGFSDNFTVPDKAEIVQNQKTLDQVLGYLQKSYDNPSMIKSDAFDLMNFSVAYGIYLASFLMIILAGSAISQEISSGSIKGLIIAPVRRSKIFFAKLANLTLTACFSLILVYLSVLVSSFSLLGATLHLPYVETNFPLFLAEIVFSKLSSVLIITFIALTLSTVIRNTSIAVGVSMILQYGLLSIYNLVKISNSIIHPVLAFLPLEYLDLSDYLLPNIPGLKYSGFLFGNAAISDFVFRTPAWFPFVYWILLAISLIWIARDSFVKRDL